MFVKTNTVEAVKHYFRERLQDQFSESEIRQMLKAAVCERLKLSSVEYLLSDRQLLSESDLLYFRSIVKRLLDNEPFQYIIGHTDFYGLTLKTDKRALIPRPETEELVEWILNTFDGDHKVRTLDLCTGTGCIALALKSVRHNWEIEGCDLSDDALTLAKENSLNNDLKVSFLKMDVLDPKDFSKLSSVQYDCWVSNPPYIPENERELLNENVIRFEPGMALFVPNNEPLLFYRSVGEQGRKYIKKGGSLFFEVHENFGSETKQMLESLGYTTVEMKKDLQGKDRMIRAVL